MGLSGDRGWTRPKLILALGLAGLAGTLGALAWRLRSQPSRRPTLPLVAELDAPATAPLGTSVLVTFRLGNLGAEPILVANRHALIDGRRDEYEVTLRRADGQALPDPYDEVGPNPVTTLQDAPDLVPLPPGKALSWTIDLTEYAVIREPGRYSVEITRHPFVDKIRVRAPIQSIEFVRK